LVAATLALLVAMPAGAGATEPSTPQGPAAATVYQPPAAYPAPRRVGGALRSGPAALPAIAVLAPDHLGLTSSEQPRLYWFIAEPTRARVEFALVRPGVDPPLAETILDASSAGIHALDLAALGVRLEPGVEYEWS